MRKFMLAMLMTVAFACDAWLAMAQSAGVITGRVVDDKGAPVAGASVRVKESNQGTSTDAQGQFSLPVNATGKTLLISYVGMAAQEMAINPNQKNIQVALQNSVAQLSDVVVIGYGTVRKKDLTGAIGSVKAAELTQIATPDAVLAMQGRVAGVQIVANSGEPGAGAKIRIRGVGSINGSNPIYVVDGYQTGDISFLSPADIESIDVLKDASATAIYGSRGANGVVVVTTKKGKKGPIRFHFDTYAGVQEAWRKIPMTNATDYANLILEGYENDGTPLNPNSELFTRLDFVRQNNFKGTNWQDEVMQQGVIQNYALTLSGGNDQNKFRLSGTYFSEEGVVRNSSMKKYFLNFGNDYTVNKWLTTGISGAYTHFDKNYYNGDLYNGVLTSALKADPLAAAWDPITNNWGRADISYTNNPARIVDELKQNKGYGNYFVGNIYADAKFLKYFSFRTQFGTTYQSNHNKSYSPKFFIATDEARDRSSLWERRGESNSWMWTNYVNFNRSFGDHTIGAMVGAEVQQSKYADMAVTAYDVPADAELMYLSSSQSVDYTVNSYQQETGLKSYFGRANYTYKDRYMLTATVRYDGSSRFLKDNRWGVFPSFAGAWVVSEESFMQRQKVLSFLKLRAGWGKVGNEQSASPYGYVTTMTGNNIYVFNDLVQQGFAPSVLSNPELRWEVNQQANVGVDMGFLNNRLNVTADYFDRRTNDMIVAVPIPNYVGAGAPRVNAGSMRNSGIEMSVGYKGGNAFKYNVSANVSFIKNEVTSLGGGAPQDGGGVGKIGNTTRTEVGLPFPYYYGLMTDGIFNHDDELKAYINKDGKLIQPDAKPGDVKFVDANGDGIITDADRVNLGNPYPDFQYGFQADLSYKNFDLRLFIQGVQGNEIVNAMIYDTRNLSNSGGGWSNFETVRLNRWSPTNTESNEMRMSARDPNNNMRFSDRYVMDGSYLRLKNIQLGYTLPSRLQQRLHMNNVRVYLTADNLFTITNYDGFDPEISDYYFNPYASGVDVGTYPIPRIFRGGLTLNF